MKMINQALPVLVRAQQGLEMSGVCGVDGPKCGSWQRSYFDSWERRERVKGTIREGITILVT